MNKARMAGATRSRDEMCKPEHHVIVVEDDEFCQCCLNSMVEAVASEYPDFSTKITLVGTGTEALEACKGDGEDLLVLLDYVLPDGTADTVLPALRYAARCLVVSTLVCHLLAHRTP